MKQVNIRFMLPATLLLMVAFCVNAQTIFSTTLDSDSPYDFDQAQAATLLQDGNVLLAGVAYDKSASSIPAAALAIKLDVDGNPLWWYDIARNTTNTTRKKLQFYSLMQDASGDCVFGGMAAAKNYDKVGSDALMAKFTSSGNPVWIKTYEISGFHEPGMKLAGLTQLPNGKYVATGYIGRGWSSGNGGLLWFQTDASGGAVSAKGFTLAKLIQGIRIVPQADNSVLIGWYGKHNFPTVGESFFPAVARVDANGNLTQQRWYVLDYSATMTDLITTSDGGYAFAGNGTSEAYLLKLDANLDVQWMKSWPITSSDEEVPSLSSVIELANGNYYLSGSTGAGLNVYNNISIVTDANGNIISSGIVNSSGVNADRIQQSLELGDGRILSIGTFTLSGINSNLFAFHQSAGGITACSQQNLTLLPTASGVLKVKNESLTPGTSYTFIIEDVKPYTTTNYVQSTLCSPVKSMITEGTDTYEVFPNPTDAYLHISFPSSMADQTLLCQVIDLSGKLIMQEEVSLTQQTLNVEQLPQGMYSYRLLDGNEVKARGTFTKQ